MPNHDGAAICTRSSASSAGASDDDIRKAYRGARPRTSPGRERHRRRRGAVQGGGGRLRDPVRSGEAPALRRVRHRRRTAGRALRRHPGHLRPVLRSGRLLDLGATDGGRVPRSRHGEDLGVRICRCRSPKRSSASARISRSSGWSSATDAWATAPNQAPHRSPAERAGGAGQVQAVRRSVFGTVMTAAPCGTCRAPARRCSTRARCARGRADGSSRRAVSVDIPAGVSDGMELRVTGNGHAGLAGGPAGDLYVGPLGPGVPGVRAARPGSVHGARHLHDAGDPGRRRRRWRRSTGPERIHVDPGHRVGHRDPAQDPRACPTSNRRGRGDLFVTLHVVTPGGALEGRARAVGAARRAPRRDDLEARARQRRPPAGPSSRSEYAAAARAVGRRRAPQATWSTARASSAGSRPGTSPPTSFESPITSSRSAT